MPYLSTLTVEHALRRLAELAAAEHLVLEIALCHGAVITVAYARPEQPIARGRIVEPSSRSDALVAEVAAEHRLPADWLKEDVKFYLALFAARRRSDVDLFGPNLLLCVSDSAHVLAMKLYACAASRPPAPADLADVEFLVQKLNLVSWAAVTGVYERFFPGSALNGDVRCLVVEMFPVPK
jgi:hypothetical protein